MKRRNFIKLTAAAGSGVASGVVALSLPRQLPFKLTVTIDDNGSRWATGRFFPNENRLRVHASDQEMADWMVQSAVNHYDQNLKAGFDTTKQLVGVED